MLLLGLLVHFLFMESACAQYKACRFAWDEIPLRYWGGTMPHYFETAHVNGIDVDEGDHVYVSSSPNKVTKLWVDDYIKLYVDGQGNLLDGEPLVIEKTDITEYMSIGNNDLFMEACNNYPGYEGVSALYILVTDGSLPDNEDGANTKEPINLITGNLYFDQVDISVPAPGFPLQFTRKYCSSLDRESEFGECWLHTYDWYLQSTNIEYVADGTYYTNHWMTVHTGDGDRKVFWHDGDGDWEGLDDNYWELSSNTNGTYEISMSRGIVYAFTSNGVLNEISDAWNNSLTLTYTNSFPSNALVKAEHSNGQSLDFTYVSNQLTTVTSPSADLYVNYSYSTSSLLLGATRFVGSETQASTYAYNEYMTQRVNAAGDVYTYDYTNNSSGKGTLLAIETNYYKHTVSYLDDQTSVVAYTVGGVERMYAYTFYHAFEGVREIVGPYIDSATNCPKIKYEYDENINKTNEWIIGADTSKYIKVASSYDDYNNLTNYSLAYCAPATNEPWVFSWDTDYHVLTSFIDPEGHKLGYDYTNGSLCRAKLYYNSTSSYDTAIGYTTNGLVAAITNANNHWVKAYYDNYGFPTSIVPELGPAIGAEYSQLGHLEAITLPGAAGTRTITFSPNELGWVTNILFPDELSNIMEYDAIGNLTNFVDRAGRTTQYKYLPTRELESITRTLGTNDLTITFSYDNQFNSLAIKDANNRLVEAYQLDDQDRPTTITNVEGQTMAVDYGVAEYINSITRFDGSQVTNSYNENGLLSKVIYSDAADTNAYRTNSFTYYKNDLLKTAANSRGAVSNTFNFANRLTASVGVAPSGTVDYTYFPAGQVSNMTSTAGLTTHSLDNADRVSQINSFNGMFNYTYNTNNGLVSQVTCTNSGVSVDYIYDVMDRVTGITWKDSSVSVIRSFAYTYNDAGMITDIEMEDGAELRYSYDDLDRLTGERRYNTSDEVLYDITYGFDNVGNRASKTSGDVAVSYTLPYGTNGNRVTGWSAATSGDELANIDVLGHSTETIGTNPNLGRLYVSNVVEQTPDVSTTNFTAYEVSLGSGTQEVIAAIGDEAGNTDFATNSVVVTLVTNASYSYSTAGCLTQAVYTGTSDYGATNDILWDQQYRITSVTTNGADAETYEYDALDRRTAIITGTATNYLVYNGIHCIAEVDANGSLKRSYTYGPGIDNILAMTDYTGGSTSTYYYITDHQGSVYAVTDSSGNIVEQYRYDAWGRVNAYDASGTPLSSSAIGNRYLWQGREYSWETGLYYFRARWYDPITGRFLSKDPIGISGGLNQYVFCGNNPVNVTDPDGLAPQLIGVDSTGRAYYSGDRDWGSYDSRCGGQGVKTRLSVLEWGQLSKTMGETYGWPYAHVFANAGITRDHGRATAYLASFGKEVVDLAKGLGGNDDSLYSAFQPLDFEMNRIGRSIPDGVSPYSWASPYENFPEGPPGPFYPQDNPYTDSGDCK